MYFLSAKYNACTKHGSECLYYGQFSANTIVNVHFAHPFLSSLNGYMLQKGCHLVYALFVKEPFRKFLVNTISRKSHQQYHTV